MDECDTYEIPYPPNIFPLDFKWLHRNEKGEQTINY